MEISYFQEFLYVPGNSDFLTCSGFRFCFTCQRYLEFIILPAIIKFLFKVETLIIAYTSKLNMVTGMSNPVDILACAITSIICFAVLYTVLQTEILILGLVLVACILFGKTLYLF